MFHLRDITLILGVGTLNRYCCYERNYDNVTDENDNDDDINNDNDNYHNDDKKDIIK